MNATSKYLVGLLIVTITFAAVPTPGQQNKRFRAPVESAKSGTAVTVHKEGLPLKRVVLYSNGVGYFERRGSVSGNSTISLQFTPEEVDDVLKSLVILDRSNGHISSVSFDTAKPLKVALSEFAFSLNGDNNQTAGMAKLLSSFTGASIEVREGQSSFAGKIIGIEKRA